MTQLYQRRRLSPAEDLGAPAPLPRELAGLSDACLADLSAWSPEYADQLGWAGEGFFPFTPEPPPPPPPAPIDELNKIDFYRLFTSAERIAIRAAAGTNDLIADYQDMLQATPRPRLSDPDLQTGVQLLELGGLLGVGRAAQILAGEMP
jgi:hypothetical protein